jgi:hypothetical protein
MIDVPLRPYLFTLLEITCAPRRLDLGFLARLIILFLPQYLGSLLSIIRSRVLIQPLGVSPIISFAAWLAV